MKTTVFLLLVSSLFASQFLSDYNINYAVPNDVNGNDDKMIQTLLKQSSTLSQTYPPKYGDYVTGMTAISHFVKDSLLVTDLGLMQTRYKLPPEVVSGFEAVQFAPQFEIKSFTFVITSTSGLVTEYVCAAFVEGPYFQFTFVRVVVNGNLVPRYDYVSKEECSYLFGQKTKCKNVQVALIRQTTFEEMDIVKKAMRAYGWEQISIKLKTLENDTQFILTQNSALLSLSARNKAMISGYTGQIYIGKSSYTPMSPTIIPQFGYGIGTAQIQSMGPFSMQIKNSGNLQILNKDKTVIWQTNTKESEENAPFKIVVTEDPHMMLVNKYWKPIWHSKGLTNGFYLSLEQDYKYYSPEGNYYALIKNDGEFILGKQKDNLQSIEWRSGFVNFVEGPHRLIIDASGTMKLVGKNNALAFKVKSGSSVGPFRLEVTDDGLIKMVDGRNNAMWTHKNANSLLAS